MSQKQLYVRTSLKQVYPVFLETFYVYHNAKIVDAPIEVAKIDQLVN